MKIEDAILDYLHYHPGLSRQEIFSGLGLTMSEAQGKRILSVLVNTGDVTKEGKARAIKYYLSPKGQLLHTVDLASYYALPLEQRDLQTSYNFSLIREILPKVEIFTPEEIQTLKSCEERFQKRIKDYPKELYSKEMERLGIDLSWKSSQIEGNTYTLLETVKLLKDSVEAEGRKKEEAIMLLNHKTALRTIVAAPNYFKELSVSKIEDIHALLVQGLNVERNIRHFRVGISGTSYRPLDNEFQIREAMEDMCLLVNGKDNPYEKALLILLLTSYIQPFNDGNKRASRLVANALLLSGQCCPLSFRTADAGHYRDALLLFYEQNNLSAFKRMFIEQAEFSAKEYF